MLSDVYALLPPLPDKHPSLTERAMYSLRCERMQLYTRCLYPAGGNFIQNAPALDR